MKKQIPVKGTWSGAEAIKDRIVSELDPAYTLVWTDHNDEMPKEIIEKYVNDGPDAARDLFYETFSDSISDQEWESMDQIIRDLAHGEEEMDALHEFEYYGILQDEIYGRDDSTPFDDMMRHAGRVWMTYDLDLDLDEPKMDMVPHEKFGSVAQAVPASRQKVAKKLGISYKLNDHKLIDLISNAGYGGSLQLLLNARVDELDHLEDGREYQFDNVGVAIIDYINGSGNDEEFDGVRIKWDRAKLKASDFYADEVCGLYAASYQDFTVKAVEK